jgi:hypothetical protein
MLNFSGLWCISAGTSIPHHYAHLLSPMVHFTSVSAATMLIYIDLRCISEDTSFSVDNTVSQQLPGTLA